MFLRVFPLTLLIFAGCATPPPLDPAPAVEPKPVATASAPKPPKRTLLQQRLRKLVAEKGWNGLSVTASKDPGATAPFEFDSGDPAHAWDLGASVDPFSAFLLLKLQEENKLKWDTRLARLYPYISDENNSLTVQDLVLHVSALPSPPEKTADSAAPASSPTERRSMLAEKILKNGHLKDQVGRFSECESNRLILRNIIEQIQQEPYEDVVREKIFAAYGLSGCAFQPDGHIRCSLADWVTFLSGPMQELYQRSLFAKDTGLRHYFEAGKGRYTLSGFYRLSGMFGESGPFFSWTSGPGSSTTRLIWQPAKFRIIAVAIDADESRRSREHDLRKVADTVWDLELRSK